MKPLAEDGRSFDPHVAFVVKKAHVGWMLTQHDFLAAFSESDELMEFVRTALKIRRPQR